MSLIKGLKNYQEENCTRFHMPGHKGKKKQLEEIINNIPGFDVTEVEGTDNLHKPVDIINKTQKEISEIYGTIKSYILVNGTTGGIISAIMSSAKPGEKILIQRNSHKSIFSSAILGDLEIEYIHPVYSEELALDLGMSIDDLEEKLKNDTNIKALILPYPSFYGVCINIKKVAEIVHKYNRILIIDEAHGSHLRFVDDLPNPAESLGADIVIQSTHKTLPALTQSSVLHVCSNRVNKDRLEKLLSIIQSSSPSYVLMASVENAIKYMNNKGYNDLKQNIDIVRCKSKEAIQKGIKVITKETLKKYGELDFDETKVLIGMSHIGITGNELEKILRKKYKIQVEMSDMFYINAFITSSDDKNDIEYLFDSVIDIYESMSKDYKEKDNLNNKLPKTESAMSIRQAFYSDSMMIDLDESINKVSADFVIPYPPGIPVLCPGERINNDIINTLKTMLDNNINIIGLDKKRIKIIKDKVY